MKTYQQYHEEWELSVQSRELAFDEWLLLQLDIKEKNIINKACEIVRDLANEHLGDWEQSCKFEDAFRKAMTDKTNHLFEKCLANVNPETRDEVRRNIELTNLTWEEVKKIVEIADTMLQTAHDRVEWEDKSEEEYYKEVLKRFMEEII